MRACVCLYPSSLFTRHSGGFRHSTVAEGEEEERRWNKGRGRCVGRWTGSGAE